MSNDLAVAEQQQASKTLVFTEKHININLPTLKATARYENAKGGLPSVRPLEHWELIERIQTEFKAIVGFSEHEMVQHPIHAYEGTALRLNWPRGADTTLCPTENYLIGRILTKLTFPHKEGAANEQDQSIAIGYHEKGIDIAFGPNIRVCSNMNIFGGKLISTYGDRKTSTPFEKMMEVLKSWFYEFKTHELNDYMTIQRLKQIPLNYEQIIKLIGNAYINARARNKGLLKHDWMNEATVGKMTDFIYQNRDKMETAWDLTQVGTELLKPGGNDLMTMLKVNRNWNDFVIESVNFSEN